ncbi:DUF3784 domain-containing protein [Neobacillus sp. YIM B02564]|uniref:DUF3784 domain-containing protein n=2 Tax=Neobacillus paridis TaxID=2803862 RepID=A0ABS1TLG8_9BACI|nr:DUF3784 domain-containing protein [Neobacillus paridis]
MRMLGGIAVSAIFFIVGYLIWKKQKLWLIAGYQDSEFKGDKKKLARDGGIFCVIIGLLTLGLSLFIELVGNILGVIYAITVVILSIIFVIKVNISK